LNSFQEAESDQSLVGNAAAVQFLVYLVGIRVVLFAGLLSIV